MRKARRLEPEVGKLPLEATGFGETEKKAKADAVKNAIERVKALMARKSRRSIRSSLTNSTPAIWSRQAVLATKL